MKVVVDAQPVFGRRAGIGAYVYEVSKRLPGLLPDDEIRLILFRFLKSERIPEGMTGGNVTVRLHTLFPRKALEAGLKLGVPLPFHLFSGRGDVYLFPNFVAYPTGGKPSALVVYDLSYLRYPDKAEAKNQRFLTRFVPPSLERARSVLTISEFSRNEISEVYRIPPEKIRVAPPGMDPALFHPRADEDACLVAAVGIDAAILTKIDADAKGGAALSIAHAVGKPIIFIGTGQDYEDLMPFDEDWMIDRLFEGLDEGSS